MKPLTLFAILFFITATAHAEVLFPTPPPPHARGDQQRHRHDRHR